MLTIILILLENDSHVDQATTGAVLPVDGRRADPVIELRQASIGYDGLPVVSGLDLAVRPGEVVALLGPNGSGKSTLVRGVLGLAKVVGGAVELFGTPAARFGDRWRVGYVPQRHTLTGGVPASVREVVSAGRLSRRRRWPRLGREDWARVDAAVAAVGLAGRERDPISELSGGQQRRVLVARALAADPELLILDEPTAGVDTANQVALAATLAALVERGTTLVLVTHELGPARSLVTRSVVMGEGRLTYDGAPAGTPPEDGGDDHHHADDTGHHPSPFGLRT